ncbi:FAD-dependent oxidoreductase, partial [Alphaproteobacteria bacterium]|nr:FAD-dependent oxidoreductase [Alphaproteobacteria bacterium]
MTAASLSVAIIGAGPAGAYAAERLVRKNPAAQIDVIDRLPTPFGLIRYGVAPDHQGTKNIERVLSRAFTKGDVQFWGGLKVGADLSLADIQANYDAVVLAVGAPQDRRLGIAGEDLAGVYGSAAFVGWYNRHPDHFDLPVDLSAAGNAIVIGAGNVALDVARVLAKTPAELSGSDVPPDVSRQLQSAPWERIRVVGRRGIEMARFGVVELDEMTRLAAAAAKVEAADLEGAEIADRALAEVWARMATAASTGRPVVRFQFCWRPEAIIG